MKERLDNYVDKIQHEVGNKKKRKKRVFDVKTCKSIAKGTIAYHKKENKRKAKIAKFLNNLLHKRGYNYDVKIIRRRK